MASHKRMFQNVLVYTGLILRDVLLCRHISGALKSETYSGAGELYIRYEQLKQELAQKGYFDFERKKPLPP